MLKNLLILTLLLNLLCLHPFPVAAQTKQNVSLLLFNGKIFTSDAQFSMAEAVAVDGEKIVAVGTSGDLKARYRAAREIDLQGQLVTPGFNDAHVHFLRGAIALLNVNLLDTKSLEEAKAKVSAKAKEVKAGEWITGRGWDHTIWETKFPTRKDLDADRARLIRFISSALTVTSAWANSAAFKLAGIDKHTKNPEGGEIERDAQGEADGNFEGNGASVGLQTYSAADAPNSRRKAWKSRSIWRGAIRHYFGSGQFQIRNDKALPRIFAGRIN